MSYQDALQPPTIPLTDGRNIGQTTNPWFTISNQFLPRNLHDVIKWARYIILHSPTSAEVIRKLATYPITEFEIDTHKDALKKKYVEIHKSLRLKETLQNVGFEYYSIGNSFLSIYFPIQRTLTCKHCGTNYNAKNADFVSFRKYQFRGKCPKCEAEDDFIRNDSKSLDINDINVIQWTPEHIVVNNNPITGEKEFFYKIPNSVKQKIQKGDKLFVNSLPWGFIEAVRFNQDFKFDKGQIFHLQNMTTGGTVEGISVPPLLSLFSLVFYQATLRKANEAIAQEHLTPLRVIFPQAQTQNSDPVVAMSLRNFVSNMTGALMKHKQDPNHIVISPTPVGYSPIGGEGRNLLVSQEIQQAEESILLSLGVSKELLSGTTNWTSSSVGLRMMENLLFSYISRLQEFIDWVNNRVATYLNVEVVGVTLKPFKLYDDDNLKQILLQMVQLGKVSETTYLNELGLDFEHEQENLSDEAASKAKTQVNTQYSVEQAQIMAARDKGKAMSENEETQTLLAKAQDMAEQLYQADEGTRRSFLAKLKTSDYTQWILVSMVLEQAQAAQAQATEQQQAQNQVGGSSTGKDAGKDQEQETQQPEQATK